MRFHEFKFQTFGRTAKIHPKDGVSRLNFPEGFGSMYLKKESENEREKKKKEK